MQVKNPFIFGLLAVLLVGGTILPAMSQTEPEDGSQIELSLDNTTYDLNTAISISGQIINFERDARDPSLDLVEITFQDSTGKDVSSSGYTWQGSINNDSIQPLMFKILPDQIGNFKLNTVLNSVLFDYGSYTVQATIYQNGNISESIDFEIVQVIEEKIVEEVQVEFVTCKSTQSLEEVKDLSLIECLDTDDFQVGDKLIIRGSVHNPDPTSDSRVSNENKELQSNQIAQKFVEVSIPYPKAMILDYSENFVTTTGYAVMNEQEIRLKNMNFRVLPDNEGNFNGAFDIRFAVFESGVYVVKAKYNGVSTEQTVRIVDPSQQMGKEPELILTTDKNEYAPGETVQISGIVKNTLYADTVTVFIESPDVSQFNCMEVDCTVDDSERKITPEQGLIEHTFSWDYKLGSSAASLGKYTINAGSEVAKSEISFFVTEESLVVPEESSIVTEESSDVQQSPAVNEEQPLKKIIKKFNRISNSEISIGLNDVEEDSGFVPRVIQGSLFTAARGQEAIVNIQISTSDGLCVIGQGNSCMVNEITRKPGAIYEIVTIGEENYKIRYSGPDVKLEKFSILPESAGTAIDIKDWNVEIIKDEQPTRFYYKVSYVTLE